MNWQEQMARARKDRERLEELESAVRRYKSEANSSARKARQSQKYRLGGLLAAALLDLHDRPSDQPRWEELAGLPDAEVVARFVTAAKEE